MAGHARYTVVIDACVFYSMLQSDALMSLCTRSLFAAKWSVRIENEWIRALSEKRPNEIDKINRRRDTMRKSCPTGRFRDCGHPARTLPQASRSWGYTSSPPQLPATQTASLRPI
jgi:hypothetical protein